MRGSRNLYSHITQSAIVTQIQINRNYDKNIKVHPMKLCNRMKCDIEIGVIDRS